MATPLPRQLLDPEPVHAAAALARLGFLAFSDVPDRPGPSYLLVALRPVPTLVHFDPEAVEYWTFDGSRCARRVLTCASAMPVRMPFAWGQIEIVDRLHVSNQYLSFGGTLWADSVDGADVAVFASPAPLFRMGGHSQGVDPGADAAGAYFSRMRVAISANPNLEAQVAVVGPDVAYAAFLWDVSTRYGARESLRMDDATRWTDLGHEARRLRSDRPDAWRQGVELGRRLET